MAELERTLQKDGLFEKFKTRFSEISGKDWEEGRKGVFFGSAEFAKAYSEVKNISVEAAENILGKQSSFQFSIENFADLVQAYIDQQPKGFRLIFCVDEIGQFIADNSKLMLSLQTIAETLQTRCKGQAFLMVTSQNEIDLVVEDMTAKQSNDFSKIMGRFAMRISLTSANADEVIRKRILEKKPTGTATLKTIYTKTKNQLRTLFEFSDNSRQYTPYRPEDEEQFISIFPFIPYQFDLFQSSVRGLSQHNAFQGKHQSVGERSMLGVFQVVAKYLADKETDQIVKYSDTYEGIRSSLRAEVQAAIILAERILDDKPLHIQILKILFLVKFVKEFKATSNNISVLLYPSFDVNPGTLKKEVQTALNFLETQTYIERVGEIYQYLTNEEKDVENEIKSTDIDSTAPGNLLGTTIFDEIIRDNKVRLDNNSQSYIFGKKIDNASLGQEKDFYLHFITPLNINNVNKENVAMRSMGNPNDLFILLGEDPRLRDELTLVCRTEKYVKMTNQANLSPDRIRILMEMADRNAERKRAMQQQIKDLIGTSKLYHRGNEITSVSFSDAQSRVKAAAQILIAATYPQLRLLVKEYSDDDVTLTLISQDAVLFQQALTPTEEEVLSRIKRSYANHERNTIKTLLDYFSGIPYGWYANATLAQIVTLLKKGKISLRKDSDKLTDKQVKDIILNSREAPLVLVEPEEDISNSQVKQLKDLHRDLFDEANNGTDAKEVARVFKERLTADARTVRDLFSQKIRYGFLKMLGEPLQRLERVSSKEYTWFYTSFKEFQVDLLNDKESVLQPVKAFMNGSQREIFDKLLNYLESNNANLGYVEQEPIQFLNEVRESETPYKGDTMVKLKTALENVEAQVKSVQTNEREAALETIVLLKKQLQSMEDFSKLSTGDASKLLSPLEDIASRIKDERFIGNIKNWQRRAVDEIYPAQLELLSRLANPQKPEPPKGEKTFVRLNDIKVDHPKPVLETPEDVEAYIQSLKSKLLVLLKKDKKISI